MIGSAQISYFLTTNPYLGRTLRSGGVLREAGQNRYVYVLSLVSRRPYPRVPYLVGKGSFGEVFKGCVLI